MVWSLKDMTQMKIDSLNVLRETNPGASGMASFLHFKKHSA
jgi:hypothetical protein